MSERPTAEWFADVRAWLADDDCDEPGDGARAVAKDLLAEIDALRAERDDWQKALQAVCDVIDPNGDYFFWRKTKYDAAKTVQWLHDENEKNEDALADMTARADRAEAQLADSYKERERLKTLLGDWMTTADDADGGPDRLNDHSPAAWRRRIDSLKEQARAAVGYMQRAQDAEAQLAALREAAVGVYDGWATSTPHRTFRAVLADIATAAAEHDARVRREALEEAARECERPAFGCGDPIPTERAIIEAAERIRALATKERP